MVKIIKGESGPGELGNMMPPVENQLQDPLSIRDGGSDVVLALHQEPQQLLRRHVSPTFRVPPERLLDVGRRLRLRQSELPLEADTHAVTPHSLSLRLRVYFSQVLLLLNALRWRLFQFIFFSYQNPYIKR